MSKKTAYFLLSLLLVGVSCLRLKLASIPLERDEGEYAYMGQLILERIPPYKEAYNMKFPGTYYAYAIIEKLFGESATGIHLGILFINLLAIVLLFFTGLKILNYNLALLAAFYYAVLSSSLSVLGFAGHATHFVVVFLIAGLLLLSYTKNNKQLSLYFFSGLLISTGCLMKQHGIFFIFMPVLITWVDVSLNNFQKLKRIFVTGLGAAIPLIILFLLMYQQGVYSSFLYWTFEYAMSYENQISWFKFPIALFEGLKFVTKSFFLIWLIAILGYFTVIVNKTLIPLAPFSRIFLIILVPVSFLVVMPGFYFRPHYFIPFLPAVALLAGYFSLYFQAKYNYLKSKKALMPLFLIIVIVPGFMIERNYYFFDNGITSSYNIYGIENAFPQAELLSKVIKVNTKPEERIFVYGSEPQIYFLSKRKSSSGFLYMYPFKENHVNNKKMQLQMLNEVQKNNPSMLIEFKTLGSWGSNQEKLINLHQWFYNFCSEKYQVILLLDIISSKQTITISGADAAVYKPISSQFIRVWKKI